MVRVTGFATFNSPVHPRPTLFGSETPEKTCTKAHTRSRPKGRRKPHSKESEQVVRHVGSGRTKIRKLLLVGVDEDT